MAWINHAKANRFAVARLKELLHYAPETGAFTRIKARGLVKAGDAVKGAACGRYRRIRVGGGAWMAHRLAWLYSYGVWPPGELQAKDGDITNIRIDNLELRKGKKRRMANPKSNDRTLTQARLNEMLCYNAATGVFTRRTAQGAARVGMVVGRRFHDNGCIYVTVCAGRYPAQLLAWLYVYGAWPDREVIFKDGVRSNVAIGNLELCTE